MDSILTSVKKLLGLTEAYTHFDPDIIMYINDAFFILNELGVGPDEPFTIEDASSKWDDFVTEKPMASIRIYVFLKTKESFDPPTNSAHLNALKEKIKEYEWRLNVAVDPQM